MKDKKYICNQCCTPYKNEKQAELCEKRCGKKKSCSLGITIGELKNL